MWVWVFVLVYLRVWLRVCVRTRTFYCGYYVKRMRVPAMVSILRQIKVQSRMEIYGFGNARFQPVSVSH